MNDLSQKADIWIPDWALPKGVQAAVTTRQFGNLAAHVGDDPAAVVLRRRRLQRRLDLPETPQWLHQQHTDTLVRWPFRANVGDGVYSGSESSVCAVLTADCLPILCCSDDGREIAAVHAGWRGLAKGILGNALNAFQASPHRIRVWIGPAIGLQAFDVGADVRDVFIARHTDNRWHFQPFGQKWLADMPAIAVAECARMGVSAVTLSDQCTVENNHQWFSWRHEKATARFASIIWRNKA